MIIFKCCFQITIRSFFRSTTRNRWAYSRIWRRQCPLATSIRTQHRRLLWRGRSLNTITTSHIWRRPATYRCRRLQAPLWNRLAAKGARWAVSPTIVSREAVRGLTGKANTFCRKPTNVRISEELAKPKLYIRNFQSKTY